MVSKNRSLKKQSTMLLYSIVKTHFMILDQFGGKKITCGTSLNVCLFLFVYYRSLFGGRYLSLVYRGRVPPSCPASWAVIPPSMRRYSGTWCTPTGCGPRNRTTQSTNSPRSPSVRLDRLSSSLPLQTIESNHRPMKWFFHKSNSY